MHLHIKPKCIFLMSEGKSLVFIYFWFTRFYAFPHSMEHMRTTSSLRYWVETEPPNPLLCSWEDHKSETSLGFIMNSRSTSDGYILWLCLKKKKKEKTSNKIFTYPSLIESNSVYTIWYVYTRDFPPVRFIPCSSVPVTTCYL